MARVRLSGVTGRYGDFTAVKELDIEAQEGEFLTLLGPSGCGKTTTLRIIAGFLNPSSGRVYFDDEDVTEHPPNKRSIGMVFQDYALFPHLTVAENIGFGLKERGYPREKIRARVSELLDLVRLPNFENRYSAQLSGGQCQRVALARAVAFLPRVLLMDEPLGALDLKLREAMQIELKNIQRELKITTVYVTHDQTEAMNMSDRIAVMNEGSLEQFGTADELYNRPRSKFVADFIGRINFIPVIVKDVSENMAVVEMGETLLRVVEPSVLGCRPATLAVRPEHLDLVALDADVTNANVLKGLIEHVRFTGNMTRVTLRVNDRLNIEVETNPGDPLVESGAERLVCWDYDRCILLEAD
jgi:spermidine/putrescine ABC transporter ATP-binding subunit